MLRFTQFFILEFHLSLKQAFDFDLFPAILIVKVAQFKRKQLRPIQFHLAYLQSIAC